MKPSEEQQLKQISSEFAKGIELFRNRECQQSFEIFNKIDEEFKDSEYYSVLEIQGRAKIYKNLCNARLNPVKVELNDDEDYLCNGIFHLNAGNLDEALERFEYLGKKNYKQDYLNYLMSLLHLKKGDLQTCFNYLKTAIQDDDFYRVIAYNEPDFEHLFENDEFVSIVERH